MSDHNKEARERADHVKMIQERRKQREDERAEEIFFKNIEKLHDITEKMLKGHRTK